MLAYRPPQPERPVRLRPLRREAAAAAGTSIFDDDGGPDGWRNGDSDFTSMMPVTAYVAAFTGSA